MGVRVAVWDPGAPEADEQFSAVLALHKLNRSTLGPLPDTAFRDRAKHNGLLLGIRGSQVIAYLLYDIPRHNLIKLVHLCVDESARGSGIARALVDEAVRLHPRRSMVAAACRTDYGLDGFWRSLGMHVASEKSGRALNGSTLANWIKRVNVEDGLDLLETASLSSGRPLAVLDTNIVGDLFCPPGERRDHREESAELSADWLQSLVTFTLSGEVNNEISQIQDPDLRNHLRAATGHLTRLSTRRPGDRSLEDALLAALDPELAKDRSLRSDVLHVADAVHAGADYFVTNDSNVCEAAPAWAPYLGGTQIVRPHQLVRALSPESYMSDFRSSLIDGSDLDWHPIKEAESVLEPAFRVYELERKPADFHRRIRELLARPNIVVEKLVDGDERLWALAAHETSGNALRLSLLRTIRGQRGTTVAFQLVRHFRRVAWSLGATRIEVIDNALSPTVDAALSADGFGDGPTRVATLGPALQPAENFGVVSALDVVRAERHHWPMVVRGAGLPTYLIPIRPAWASRLLGLNDGLLFTDRRRGLGLSRELVYFSGSRVTPSPLPARVLWYASGDKTTQVSRIVARSIMVDAVRVRTEDAITQFAHLGVLRQSEIRASADRSGRVSVIRFQDTELLSEPVSMRDELFRSYVRGEVRSMRSVDPEFFDLVLDRQHLGEPAA